METLRVPIQTVWKSGSGVRLLELHWLGTSSDVTGMRRGGPRSYRRPAGGHPGNRANAHPLQGPDGFTVVELSCDSMTDGYVRVQ